MNFELVYIRLKAFVAEAGVMVLAGLVTVLASSEFSALVVEHFGQIWGGGIGLLVLNGLVKHLMNLKALKDYKNRLGSADENEPPVLI